MSLPITMPVKSARFVLASWSYPDEYGQGIEAIRAYQYLDGGWVAIDGGFDVGNTESTTFNISESGPLNLTLKCWLNNTLVRADDLTDGLNYIRLSVIVSTPSNSSIFSQYNFSLQSSTDALDPMFYYQFWVTLDFAPVESTTYRAVVTCEIYYSEE